MAVAALCELRVLTGREKVPKVVAEQDETLAGRATKGCDVSRSTAVGLSLALRCRQR